MTTFLNIDLNKPIHWKLFVRHVLFSVIWIIGMSIFIFRIDLYFNNFLNKDLVWIIRLVPFAYILIVLVIMFRTRWYYNLALSTYPLLVIFWFLPKLILANGKIYLFSNYLSNIFNYIKNFKNSIIHTGLFFTTTFLLFITDSNIIRICSMFIISYFYIRYLTSYVKKSFRAPRLFGVNIEKSMEDIVLSPEKGMYLIKTVEEQKVDEKLTEDAVKIKKLERLIIVNFVISYFKDNLSGFNGKKAFVISWIYQLIGFLFITLLFYTFLNFELFIIESQNYEIIGSPKLFDFFYYTIKTITFGNISAIVPASTIARIIEILSFLTLGIFLLIIVTSVIFSLRQDRISDNVKKATDLCVMQTEVIAEHIKNKYQTNIETVLRESSNIKTSLANLKTVIEKLF